MKNPEKTNRMNDTLKSLYEYMQNNNCNITGDIIYNYLIQKEVSPIERSMSIGTDSHDNFFKYWIENFKKNPDISTYVIPEREYFCHFKSRGTNSRYADDDYDYIKMYIPLDYHHLLKGATKIFEFIASNGIEHQSKIASDIRVDNIVIRVRNEEDAKKIQEYVEKDSYIQEGLIQGNPFAFDQNGISYAYDGEVSYNTILSELLALFLNETKKNNIDISKININSFASYLDTVSPSTIRNLSARRIPGRNPNYAILATQLIKLSLRSDDLKNFYDFYNKVRKIKKDRHLSIPNIEINDQTTTKQELFQELILTTIKKFPPGHDKKNPQASGIEHIFSYLNGYETAVTRDNDLRNRVAENLSPADSLRIISESGIPGNNINEQVVNYIYMTSLNEIIRCNKIRFKDVKNVDNIVPYNLDLYIETGDETRITNSVNQARHLAPTLSPLVLKKFLYNMGVSSVKEYKTAYYDHKNPEGPKR